MDQDVVVGFILYVKHQRLVVDYAYVASAAVLLYDFALLFPLEVKHIWFSKWNYAKVLYILTRYLPLFNVVSSLYGQISPEVSRRECNTIYIINFVLMSLSVTFAELILALRTWAVWNLKIEIGLALAALEVANTIISAIYSARFIESVHAESPPYPGFRGCPGVRPGDPDIPWQSFVALVIVEFASVMLAFMATSAFRAYRHGYTSELSNIIYRDGLQYYFYLMSISIGNVVMLRTIPADLSTLLLPLQTNMHSIFATRIIINIRVAARSPWDSPTALHEWCQQEGLAEPMTLSSGSHSESRNCNAPVGLPLSYAPVRVFENET